METILSQISQPTLCVSGAGCTKVKESEASEHKSLISSITRTMHK